MPQIQLDSARPGIRGAETVSVGEKAVDNGILAPIGDTLKRLPQLYVNTDLHTRMEKLADTLDDNAALEAELAFDRWNAQALYGSKDNQTATAYADFEKEKDPTLRAMQLNGLLHARGMAAADGGKMYDAASQAVMNEMLGGMRPEARVKVALRLKAKREDTLRRLNERGFAQAEAAQTARQKELLARRAELQGEEAARDTANVEAEYEAAVRQANADYATTMASILPEHVLQGQAAKDGVPEPDYEEYKKDYEAKAESSREGAIAAARAKLLGGYAGIGAAYARNRAETDALTRASIIRELGLTEEQAASAEWAPIVEGKIAAAQQEHGAAFLESMLGNGHTDFVEAALGDPAALAAEYGIRDRRITDALQLKIAKARNDAAKADEANREYVNYLVAQCNAIDPRDGSYKISDEQVAQWEKTYAQAGDFNSAKLFRDVMNQRLKAYNNDRLLSEKDAAKQQVQAAQAAVARYTPEQLECFLNRMWADTESEYVYIDMGEDEETGERRFETFSKFAFTKWAVQTQLGITDKKKQEEKLKSLTGGFTRDIRAARLAQEVFTRGQDFDRNSAVPLGYNGDWGHFGWHYQSDEVDANGNYIGPMYWMRGTPEDRNNVFMDSTGDLIWNKDQFKGRLLVRTSPNAYGPLNADQIQESISLIQGIAEDFIATHPEASDDEARKYIFDAACYLYGGWNDLKKVGFGQSERSTNLRSGFFRGTNGYSVVDLAADRQATEAQLNALSAIPFFSRPNGGLPAVVRQSLWNDVANYNRESEDAEKAKQESQTEEQ